MLKKELATAIALARTAGERILEFYALEIIAEQKLGVDNLSEPVTIADRTASRMIVEGLAEIFPDDAILSEEEADDLKTRLSADRVWMIDPIDGTQGFINKDGDFGVQIGLTEKGEAVLGVVFLPFHDELFYATRGAGAFLVENNEPPQPLEVSAKTNFSALTLAVSRNHLSPKMARISEDLKIKNIIHRGSVGLKIGLIARQTADLYIHLSPRTKYWDSCAPQIILEEAGGTMTDIFGAPLYYDLHDVQNHNGILASNGAAHAATVQKLRLLLNEFGRRTKTNR